MVIRSKAARPAFCLTIGAEGKRDFELTDSLMTLVVLFLFHMCCTPPHTTTQTKLRAAVPPIALTFSVSSEWRAARTRSCLSGMVSMLSSTIVSLILSHRSDTASQPHPQPEMEPPSELTPGGFHHRLVDECCHSDSLLHSFSGGYSLSRPPPVPTFSVAASCGTSCWSDLVKRIERRVRPFLRRARGSLYPCEPPVRRAIDGSGDTKYNAPWSDMNTVRRTERGCLNRPAPGGPTM